MLREKRTSSSVSLNRLSISSTGSTVRLLGSSTRRIVLGQLVAHVAQQRQLLLGQQLGDALDQLGLLHLVGDLGDDDLVGAAARVLLLPPGAQAEAAAAGPVGFEDRLARLDDHAAGREVRPRHDLHQLVDGARWDA